MTRGRVSTKVSIVITDGLIRVRVRVRVRVRTIFRVRVFSARGG